MKRKSRLFLLFISLFVFISCSEKKISEGASPIPLKKNKVEDSRKGISFSFHPKVDILFIVDDSGSMDIHQSRLSRNVDLFLDNFFKNTLIDYHIGVLTSSIDSWMGEGDGKLYGEKYRYIDSSTPDPSFELKLNLQPGTLGSATEQFFEPVRRAITPPLENSYNQGFYRSDAYLALIFITDAEDQNRGWTSDSFYQFLLNLKNNDAKKILSYGAIIPLGNRLSCNRSGEPEPEKLEDFIVNQAKGKIFNLCSPKYGEDLAKVGEDIQSKIDLFIPLKQLPVVDTIVVKWGNQIIPQDRDKGWIYDIERAGIYISKEAELKDQPGASLNIYYDPAIVP